MRKKSIVICMLIAVLISLVSCQGEPNTIAHYGIGESIETKQISERDGELYPVEYKITKVELNSEAVAQRIREYNLSARGSTVEYKEYEDLEYGIVDYEVYYPADYPDDVFGITAVALKFSVVGLDGKEEIKGENSVFKGLTDTWEIGKPPMGYDFYAGNVYQGSFVFLKPKNCTSYLFRESYGKDEERIDHYIGQEEKEN